MICGRIEEVKKYPTHSAMTSEKKKIRGTREWAVANVNCCTGCTHGCRYCYARYDAVVRKGIVTAEQWENCRIHEKDLVAIQPHYPGQVMFPTTHDIVPENLEACLQVINNLLKAENRVLLVTKPHFACIESICDAVEQWKELVLFRFTITASSEKLLSFWEPGAPSYIERLASLKLAFKRGFETSVSIEPMLDTSTVVGMVAELEAFVTQSIWLGKMNKISERVEVDSQEMAMELNKICQGQRDEIILGLYRKLRHNPLVFWKESIKEIVGLELAQEPGLDK